MIDLGEYFENHKKEMVDSDIAKESANAIHSDSFEGLSHLITTLPLGRDTQAWRDKSSLRIGHCYNSLNLVLMVITSKKK
jgi:hypothetical protein